MTINPYREAIVVADTYRTICAVLTDEYARVSSPSDDPDEMDEAVLVRGVLREAIVQYEQATRRWDEYARLARRTQAVRENL